MSIVKDDVELLTILLNDKYYDINSLFVVLEEKQISISSRCGENSIKCLELLLEWKNHDMTCILEYIDNSVYKSKFMFFTAHELYKIFKKSRYFDPNIFYEKNFMGHTPMVAVIEDDSTDLLEEIINSKYYKNDMLLINDMDSDYFVLHAISSDRHDIIKFLNENEKVDKQIFKQTNNYGENCLHVASKKNMFNILLYLLDNIEIENMLNEKNKEGETPFHIACKYELKNTDSAHLLCLNRFFNLENMYIKNNEGHNPLMVALKNNNKQVVEHLIHSVITNDKNSFARLLTEEDNCNINVIMMLIQYCPSLFGIIKKHLTYEMLDKKDMMLKNSFIYACEYSSDIVKSIIDLDIFDQKLLFIHSDKCVFIDIVVRKQPVALKYIFGSDKITYDHYLYSNTQYDISYVQYSAKYNAESLKYILKYHNNSSSLISLKDSLILTACKYNPESVKYFLEYNYINEKSLFCTDSDIFHTVYTYQPRAFKYILEYILSESKNKEIILNLKNSENKTVLTRVKERYPNITTYAEILTLHPNLDIINEIAEENERVCEICVTYTKNAIMIPCMHILCAACINMVDNCPMCRVKIDKIKII